MSSYLGFVCSRQGRLEEALEPTLDVLAQDPLDRAPLRQDRHDPFDTSGGMGDALSLQVAPAPCGSLNPHRGGSMAKTPKTETKAPVTRPARTTERRPTEERRVEIADAVLELIGRSGVASLTLDAIAKEIGVTQSALFRHFASRDEILEAVAKRIEELVTAAMPPPDAPPLERIEGLFDVVALVGKTKGIGRFIFSEQLSLALPTEAAARIARIADRTRAFVASSLAEGAAAGQVRRDIPPKVLAVMVIGTLQTSAFLSIVSKGEPLAPSVAKRALRKLIAP